MDVLIDIEEGLLAVEAGIYGEIFLFQLVFQGMVQFSVVLNKQYAHGNTFLNYYILCPRAEKQAAAYRFLPCGAG